MESAWKKFSKEQIKLTTKVKLAGNWDLISRAPGRINLIGEHTDYNGGLVFPAAVDKYMYFACRKTGTKTVEATALDLNEQLNIDLTDLKITGTLWADFISGILLQFQERGYELSGFEVALTSEVPIGSGMSSSSALEMGVILAIATLHNIELPKWDAIEMSQKSNHEFLGIKGGILDQFSSSFGQLNRAMLMDCSNRSFEYVDIDLKEYELLLINSCVTHNHLLSGYNDRVKECQQALQEIQSIFPNVETLSDEYAIREVSFSNELLYKRASFIREENDRVNKFRIALNNSDLIKCGQLLNEGHRGLSSKYEVSCDELDFLASEAKSEPGVLGCRMMGGGFGGCTINLIKSSNRQKLMNDIEKKYINTFGIEPEFYSVHMSDGAGILRL
jgi:galactokinase